MQVIQSGREASSKGKGKKKLKQSERREREGAGELGAEGSGSVQLSQSWLMMEAVKIHLLPAHYSFVLKPGAQELK